MFLNFATNNITLMTEMRVKILILKRSWNQAEILVQKQHSFSYNYTGYKQYTETVLYMITYIITLIMTV